MGLDPTSGRVYVLEVIRKRLEPALVGPAMREAMERHDIRRVYLEKAGFWSDQIQVIKKQFGLPIIEIQPNKDKVARAMPAADYAATGRLLLPARAPWLADFLHELLAFPNGEHDDQVDAVSHGVHVATTLKVLKVGGRGQGGRSEEADGWQIGR
jgi:predicted phage terminase large subunit-like protein